MNSWISWNFWNRCPIIELSPQGSWIHEFHEINEIGARSSSYPPGGHEFMNFMKLMKSMKWVPDHHELSGSYPRGVMNSWISWNSWNRSPIIMSWVVHPPGGHEFMNFMKFMKSMKSMPDHHELSGSYPRGSWIHEFHEIYEIYEIGARSYQPSSSYPRRS